MQWVQNEVLSRNSLNVLQEIVDNCMVMGNIGRIPWKITMPVIYYAHQFYLSQILTRLID